MCRTGCKTRNHSSYAQCCRSVAISVGETRSSASLAWDRELDAYDNAVAQGIQPAGTTMEKVEQAVRISDATGVPYKADLPHGI